MSDNDLSCTNRFSLCWLEQACAVVCTALMLGLKLPLAAAALELVEATEADIVDIDEELLEDMVTDEVGELGV